MSNRCMVCDIEATKTGRHYGAITCYPCRAFFRRAQTRKRELRCKNSGKCRLDGNVKKFCPCCRYEKCISIGMKPEYVLDEDGINQRFKYAKGRPARGPSELGDLEASSSSELPPSPRASPLVPESLGSSPGSQGPVLDFRRSRGSITEEMAGISGQDPVMDLRRKEVASLSPEQPGPGSVRATPSPGRGWFSPLTGSGPPSISSLEVSPARLWPTVHQSPRRSFHSEASISPRSDWFTSHAQNLNSSFVRPGMSPVGGADWYPPAPETIIKEELDPIQPQPIRVSVIRSNPNTNSPIKVETPATGLEAIPRVPFGLEQEDFVLPAPTPIIPHPLYPSFNSHLQHTSIIQERGYKSESVGLPMAKDLSTDWSQTHQAIIRMMNCREKKNQEALAWMKYQSEKFGQPKAEKTVLMNFENRMENPRFEEIAKEDNKCPDEDSLSDEIIVHYLHKKFRKTDNSPCQDMEDPHAEKEENGVMSLIPSYKNQIDMDMEMESYSPTSISSLLSQPGLIDTQEFDHMFMDDLEKVFFKSWTQVNVGEFVMKAYMDFCVQKGDLAPMFFTAANMQFREKFLNFIVSYDVIDLPMKTLYNVIKKNLGVAQSLVYVVQFNQPNADKELRFGSGDLDWEQWQNRHDQNIKSVQFSQMMHHIAIPDSSKMELLSCLLQMCLPIMQDYKVFILTFLLGLFNNETDPDVVRLRNMFESILVKYLMYNYKKFSKMNEMKNVKMIIDQLENLSKMVK